MRLSIQQIADFTGASILTGEDGAERVVEGLSWDSRTAPPGGLFVTLQGDNADGNDFIAEALGRGVAAVLASSLPDAGLVEAARQSEAALLFARADNGTELLQRLAKGWRGLLDCAVIGITGSSGKTTTKDLVAQVLSASLYTSATAGNYNNEIGAPATVLAASLDTKALVVEMGMQARGEISTLCDIARPRIGVITNIGVAHCELLGSRENIALAKAELLDALPEHTGWAVLNGDDPYTPFMREAAGVAERDIRVLLYGLGSQNDIRATNISWDKDGHPSFDLWLPDGQPRRSSIALQGEHNVYNALAAAACGYICGVAPQGIVRSLPLVRPAAMRQETRELPGPVTLIDDTYNANPDSMRAALALLGRMDPARPHIAVLGDMYELGEEELRFHREVGAFAHMNKVDRLICVGALAKSIADGAASVGMPADKALVCATAEEAIEALAPLLGDRPIILVKASRGMHLERIVEEVAKRC
jgi:UDP-N-acetylmuramoyl-tripeptide--D-alanyl-D-alanine ligase